VNGLALQQTCRDFEADQVGQAGKDDVARQLKLGQDFDIAVLGISLGGLKQVCASFPARLPASNWASMFTSVALTPTCAMQIWTLQTLSGMGSQNAHRTLTGADQPYSTWSDMTHLLERECWTGAQPPQAILYFCGQLQIQQGLASPHKQASNAAVGWLNSNAALYWANAQLGGSPYGLDPAVIFDPDPAAGGDVFDRHYVRANSNPSDLYVQSPPGSVTSRMDANQSGLGNVFLAGDWTRNGLNSGCAESAARSGYRCALAIVGALPPLLM